MSVHLFLRLVEREWWRQQDAIWRRIGELAAERLWSQRIYEPLGRYLD